MKSPELNLLFESEERPMAMVKCLERINAKWKNYVGYLSYSIGGR